MTEKDAGAARLEPGEAIERAEHSRTIVNEARPPPLTQCPAKIAGIGSERDLHKTTEVAAQPIRRWMQKALRSYRARFGGGGSVAVLMKVIRAAKFEDEAAIDRRRAARAAAARRAGDDPLGVRTVGPAGMGELGGEPGERPRHRCKKIGSEIDRRDRRGRCVRISYRLLPEEMHRLPLRCRPRL